MADPGKRKEVIFSPEEFEQVSRHLIGGNIRLYPNIIIPQSAGPARIQDKTELYMTNLIESCAFKSVMSFVVGGVLGGFIGLFNSSIAPHQTAVQMTAKETLVDMKNTIVTNGKQFATIGFMFAGVECIIESYRAKTDWKNAVYAGGTTGALLGYRAGLRAAGFGGVTFAAFSAGIEYFMHHSTLFQH